MLYRVFFLIIKPIFNVRPEFHDLSLFFPGTLEFSTDVAIHFTVTGNV